jgi:PTH1 family peptidyl-tRNA hydrolase
LNIVWDLLFVICLLRMKIIVGLGNPGRKYERTRHNAGFMALDELARGLRFDLSREKYQAFIGKGMIGDVEALLAKPQTYMNESGRSVGAILRYTRAKHSDLIVVHDEIDLPLGVVRVKAGGGHGGHNGLRSIIEHLGTPDFIRVRVGVGRPSNGLAAADHVLSRSRPVRAEDRGGGGRAGGGSGQDHRPRRSGQCHEPLQQAVDRESRPGAHGARLRVLFFHE